MAEIKKYDYPQNYPDLSLQQSVDVTCGIDFKLFKLFLQIRERDDLIVVFVIYYSIGSYDNPTKNHCSERDPPRPRSEHKFYGIFLLVNSHTAIYIYRKLSRDVPVFAQIGAAGSKTNQAGSNNPNAIRKNQGGG